MTAARVEQAVRGVERATRSAADADELLQAVSETMHRVVPHDASTWFGVDPVTLLATAPSRVETLDAGMCATFWQLEFYEHDTGLFVDLARTDGVSAMRLALADRTGRSPRYRDFMVPQGYGDELRAAMRVGGSTWGLMGLYRDAGRSSFDDDDVAVVRAVSPLIATALRTHVRHSAPWLDGPCAPGMIVVDHDGRVVSSNDEAICWLRELWPLSPASRELDTGLVELFDRRSCDLEVPTPLFALIARARAVAEGRERTPARLRLRDRRGRWLVLHASVMSGPGSPEGDLVALVIEAAKSAEVAPIIIEAYSLTARERDVLGALARGGSTAEIAATLYLSPHTVRDHIKTIFEKVGVSSRGELVARLFGEHYIDPLHETMVHD